MNIARELGSLISGLLAPQASSSVQKLGKTPSNRSQTTTQDQTGNRKTARSAQGSDRLTLSKESLSLANSTQEQSISGTVAATTSPIQASPLLALPYSPSTTSPPQQQAGEESPATREMVRSAYGNSESSATTETLANPARINFHA
ncbi:MAG: hypothetical protein BA870_10130 [Desulfuromonadales bacterium C00003094]|jgi:hypothetical protein|nr:MAG: hypothetical protein BA870_10130 [Desulfuromonadales bacterium C00003094]